MKLFGLTKQRKVEVEDVIWRSVTKQELIKRFQYPYGDDQILVVNAEHQPVLYFRAYYYASAWEFYEIGRSVSVFADNKKKVIFLEDAKNTRDYQYEDISFGKETEVLSFLNQLECDLYTVSEHDYEDFVNRNHKMAWQHNGITIHSGEKIHVNSYIAEDNAQYPDINGNDATVVYRFCNDKPFLHFEDDIKNCRVFRDGVHMVTICGSMRELPLTDNCSIESRSM